jgi:hypothetical protein
MSGGTEHADRPWVAELWEQAYFWRASRIC